MAFKINNNSPFTVENSSRTDAYFVIVFNDFFIGHFYKSSLFKFRRDVNQFYFTPAELTELSLIIEHLRVRVKNEFYEV